MSTSGPLTIGTRQQMRQHLTTLAGRRYSWGHLSIKHNSVARMAPCRFCERTAHPTIGPVIFWGDDPICDTCAAEIAPELFTYATTLQRIITHLGGDWRALLKRAA